MLNKAQNTPIEDFNEYLRINPGSFTATAGQTSDDWRTTALIDGTPARPTHQHDNTTYPAGSFTTDSWLAKLHGWQSSPARAAAGTIPSGVTRGTVP